MEGLNHKIIDTLLKINSNDIIDKCKKRRYTIFVKIRKFAMQN